MKHQATRSFLLLVAITTLFVLVPTSSLAAQALFRVERSFFGAPFPAVTSPGGAGRFENYLEPYTSLQPAVASVTTSNTIGAPFTLPKSFIDYQGTFKNYASTAFPGYTSFSYVTYINGPGVFRPNNPYGATTDTRVVFPTTGGNPTPNLGTGDPVTATTTFGGDFDFSRGGSIFVEPGPNRFGGTMRFLYAPTSLFYQYIYYFTPTLFKAYGSFRCQKAGVDCTDYLETQIGEITSSGMVNRYLLTASGAKATTGGSAMNFAVSKAYYLHLLAPWSTGKASVYNQQGVASTFQIRPQMTGYDKQLGGADITVTRTSTTAYYKGGTGMGKVYYSYFTSKAYLMGVTRVVSLVRPRITHQYLTPRNPSDPIQTTFQAARLWTMKVFFLPEPGQMVLLGAGLAGLAALSLRRR